MLPPVITIIQLYQYDWRADLKALLFCRRCKSSGTRLASGINKADIAANSGFFVSKFYESRQIAVGEISVTAHDRRKYKEYESAIEELVLVGYMEPMNMEETDFELTKEGWEAADFLEIQSNL